MQENTSYNTLILAVLISLILHLGMLALADYLQQHKTAFMTITKINTENEDDLVKEDDPEDKTKPKITPGIENGAPATVTWIGYAEYEKHLAQLAEVEQAAFTTNNPLISPPQFVSENQQASQADVKSVINKTDTNQLSELNYQSERSDTSTETTNQTANRVAETIDVPDAQPDNVEYVTDNTNSENVIPVINDDNNTSEKTPELAQEPPDINAESEVVKTDAETETTDKPGDDTVVTELENETVNDADKAAEPDIIMVDEQPDDLIISEQTTKIDEQKVNGKADTDNEIPKPVVMESDQPVVPVADISDKDSEATSTKKIPEIDWQNGKPIAVEGVEILPYSLYRHIIVDSKDRMFAVRWDGMIKRNPIVSLQFDRMGKVRHVTLLRNTGYKTFDDMYLSTWLSRWTAKGKSLQTLKKDELCEPIIFKLLFIDEPEPNKQNDKPVDKKK